MAVFRIEKTQNYTVMSNHHLRNATLTLKAKGLLSQMLSLPDSWDYTLAGLAKINRESIDAIRTAVWELEKAGYIVRQQGRDNKGKMMAIEYIIYEQPQEPETPPPPLPPKRDYPVLENPIADNPTSANPVSGNPMQSIKEELTTYQSNIKLKNTDSLPFPSPRGREAKKPGLKGMEAIAVYRDIIKDNIEYDILMERYPLNKPQVNELLDIMLESVCSARKTIRVAGDDYPAELVKSKLLNLNSTHIEFVIECVKKNTSDIKNIKKYLLACLFNAPSTIDTYYTSLVAHDMAHGLI
jgi:hypothetical protein